MSNGAQPKEGDHGEPRSVRGRPRWPGAASLLVIGAVYTVLRDDLRVAPSFLLLVLVGVLILLSLYAQLRGRHHLSHLLGLALVGLANNLMGCPTILQHAKVTPQCVGKPSSREEHVCNQRTSSP